MKANEVESHFVSLITGIFSLAVSLLHRNTGGMEDFSFTNHGLQKVKNLIKLT